jgi:hypothetical protein
MAGIGCKRTTASSSPDVWTIDPGAQANQSAEPQAHSIFMRRFAAHRPPHQGVDRLENPISLRSGHPRSVPGMPLLS